MNNLSIKVLFLLYREQGGLATLSDKSHQEASDERGYEYTWVQGYWNPDKGRKAVAYQMGREEKTVHGKITPVNYQLHQ